VALACALVVAVGIAFVVRDAGTSQGADADRVSLLDHTLRKALVAGDSDTLDSVLAARFELVDPSGDRQARDGYLSSVSSGNLDYEAFDPVTPVDVRVSGDVAVVTYESQLKVSSGALHLRHRAWHTHVYEKAGGRWRLVWSQATAVGGFPPTVT
jgi:ketosteroid isomerase-like protein